MVPCGDTLAAGSSREWDMKRRILFGLLLAIPVVVFLIANAATAIEY